jgi:hypothetical protein
MQAGQAFAEIAIELFEVVSKTTQL